MALLQALVRAGGEPVTREALGRVVARRHLTATSRTVDTHICTLRRKLGDDPKSPKVIVTIQGLGYAVDI